MRILQVSHRVPYPLKDGGAIGIYNYTKGFHEAGCKVTLLALNAKKHDIDPELAAEEMSKYCEFIPVAIDTDIKPLDAFLNLFSTKSYNVERFYSKEFEDKLAEVVKNNDFDLIQVEGTYVAMYTPVIKKLTDAPIVLRQHNVEYQIWERLAENEPFFLKKWYLNLLAKRLKKYEQANLSDYDALVPVTQDDADLFAKLGSKLPVLVSPAGIDTDRLYVDNSKTEFPSVFHIGSLEWMPNREALMWFLDEVWPLVVQKQPTAKFYVAGKGMPSDIKNLNRPNVVMVGEVEDAVEFMQSKAVMVVPLLSGSGIRLKILEGMSMGKAIVSTHIGASGIEYIDGENIIIADSADDFAKGVIECISDRSKTDTLGANARKLIENKYSNQAVISRMLDFYKVLSGQKRLRTKVFKVTQ